MHALKFADGDGDGVWVSGGVTEDVVSVVYLRWWCGLVCLGWCGRRGLAGLVMWCGCCVVWYKVCLGCGVSFYTFPLATSGVR